MIVISNDAKITLLTLSILHCVWKGTKKQSKARYDNNPVENPKEMRRNHKIIEQTITFQNQDGCALPHFMKERGYVIWVL